MLVFMLSIQLCVAQQPNFWSRSELGLHVGQMYYIGEINPYIPFNESNNAFGLMYRLNKHSRMSYRLNYTYGSLSGYDAKSNFAQNVNRNLSFQTSIHELSAGIELHFKMFQMGNKRYPETFYFILEGGIFRMNPKTNYGGQILALRELGTEGQLGRKRYNLYQLCIPIGIGYKFNIGTFGTFNIDIAIRKTFTDYIDDVGSANYASQEDFYNHTDPDLSYALSNQSLDGSATERRGNPATKDWYVYAGATLAFKLGSGNICWDFK